MKEQNIGGGKNTVFHTSKTVEMNNTLQIKDQGEYFDLNIKIIADLNEVPENYHEILVNMMTSKYLNVVSFGDNPFSRCEPIVKKSWWQFWK